MDYSIVSSIMILGDSLSKGVVLNEEKHRYYFSGDRFLSRLEKAITPVIHDFSKFGSTTAYGLEILDKKLHQEKPGLAFIEYGSNDSDYDWPAVAKNPRGRHLPRLSLTEYTGNLAAIIRRVRRAGFLPVVTNLHPLVSERYFNWFTKGKEDAMDATMIWLKDLNNIYWWQEMYSSAAERTARRLGVPVLNIRRAFLNSPNYEKLMCLDGIHPNEAGHALIYETLMNYIHQSAGEWIDRSHSSAQTTNG